MVPIVSTRKARRFACADADQVRTRHQPQDRKGPWSSNAATLACQRRRGDRMRRRELIKLLGGATAWPLAARAQQTAGMRRIGVLLSLAESDEGKVQLAGFMQGLAELGWIDGRNLRMEVRW